MQGCPHHCKGCHNPETWNVEKGFLVDVKEVCEKIRNVSFQTGVTLSGRELLIRTNK